VVTNEQLYIAVGIPLLFNAALMGVVFAYVNAKLQGVDAKFDARFDAIDRRFDAIDRRFDDMRELWRAELHRVEEVLDARLRHLEERR
jgi:predicted ATPase